MIFCIFFAFCRLIPSQFKSTYGCFREGQEVLITPTRFLTRNQACLREFLEVQLFNLLIFDQSLWNLSRINVIHTRLTILFIFFLFAPAQIRDMHVPTDWQRMTKATWRTQARFYAFDPLSTKARMRLMENAMYVSLYQTHRKNIVHLNEILSFLTSGSRVGFHQCGALFCWY